jgi:hypothetical protein
VLLGAAATFASTRFAERTRWKHERDSRWDVKLLDSYAEFSDTIKQFISLANRIAAARGLNTAQPLDPEAGLEQLAQAEIELSLKWEHLLLLGDPATVIAAREWRHAAWHLEWFARGLRSGQSNWDEASMENSRCRRAFYEAARAGLAITGGLPPESEWPLKWQVAET